MNLPSTPPLREGSFRLPSKGDRIKTSVFTCPPKRDSSIPSDPTAPAAAFPQPLRRLSRRPGS